MTLQGVKLTIQPLEVGYAKSPKKAPESGYVVFPPIYRPAWLRSNNLRDLTGKGPYWGGGGATWKTRRWDPGTPPWARGSIYKKKVLQDPGPNTHRATTIGKVVLTPPQPPPPKKGYPGMGGYGGQN